MRLSPATLCSVPLLFLLLSTLPSAVVSFPSLFSYSSSAYQALTSHFSPSPVWHPTPSDAESFLHFNPHLSGARHIVDVRESLLRSLTEKMAFWRGLSHNVVAPSAPSDDATLYPYWRMIPAYISSLTPEVEVTWSSPCFSRVSAMLYKESDDQYSVTIINRDATSRDCSDNYLLATLEGYKLHTFTCFSPLKFLCNQKISIAWNASNATDAELFDVDTKGIRLFRFQDNTVSTLDQLEATLTLFEPLLTQKVEAKAAAANIDFLSKYANVTGVSKRAIQQVPVDASLIHSGDFFGVLRLDGLDPMLAWAMGSVTGHTVLALWMDEPPQLYIIESTNNNSYWTVNGIQRTPYLTWLANASAADYNVVWAPLTAEAAAKFNATAASEYFFTQEGYDYGYHNLLWGWQDTVLDNYPCLPPSFSLCLTPHHVQVLFGFIDRVIPSVGDILFIQAWNKRLGTEGLSFAQLLQHANQTSKISAEVVPVIVERDEWTYATSRHGVAAQGPAQVCCVFVCNVWKSAGLFGNLTDSFECAEQTNFDDYSLNLLTTPTQRPKQCVNADPNNPLCQLEGEYTLELGPEYGVRTPYAHMGERCPSLAPQYSRPSNC